MLSIRNNPVELGIGSLHIISLILAAELRTAIISALAAAGCIIVIVLAIALADLIKRLADIGADRITRNTTPVKSSRKSTRQRKAGSVQVTRKRKQAKSTMTKARQR